MSGGKPIDDAALQRYFDGEASADERTRVEAALQQDPDAQARFEALAQMRSLLCETVDTREQGATINVWDAVREGIRQPAPAGERPGEWWRERWLVPAAVAAMAVSAVALVFVLARPEGATPTPTEVARPTMPSGPSGPAKAPVPSTPGDAVATAGHESPVVEIESIETKAGAPTIVMTAAQAGQPAIPVVWIEELK
jgi:anti-sigma factor RsiW